MTADPAWWPDAWRLHFDGVALAEIAGGLGRSDAAVRWALDVHGRRTLTEAERKAPECGGASASRAGGPRRAACAWKAPASC